jgi:hypothetical protein
MRFYFSSPAAHDALERRIRKDLAMSTATLTINSTLLHAYSRLVEALFVPHSAARAAGVMPGVLRPAEARKPHPPLLDRLDRWFDGLTDDRAELERYLARSQNLADLENRMREALHPQPPLRF